MPNWCNNHIIISGNEKKILLLKNIIENDPKSKEDECIVFETLIGTEPEPEEYENDSNVDWFGTKRDVSYNDCGFEFNDNHIIMTPLTAWSPPIGFVSNLCKMYGVTAVMNYDERGSDICGRVTVDINGEIDHEEYKFNEGHYHFDNGHFWEGLVYSDLEDALEEGKTKDQFILKYPYLDEGDKKELEKMYDKYIIENNKIQIK